MKLSSDSTVGVGSAHETVGANGHLFNEGIQNHCTAYSISFAHVMICIVSIKIREWKSQNFLSVLFQLPPVCYTVEPRLTDTPE